MKKSRILAIVLLIVVVAVIGIAIYHNKHKDDTSTNQPNLSVAVYNSTQSADGTTVTAHAKDNLVYSLTAVNPTDKIISGYVVEVGIANVVNNATLIDAQGANYDSGNSSLIWTPLDIPAQGSIQKQFTVRIKDTLPTDTALRVVKVTYSNEVVTNLADVSPSMTPAGRPGNVGTGTTYHAPQTGIPGWISFLLASFITFGVLLIRLANKLGKPKAKLQ
jgi:hypothetical protein